MAENQFPTDDPANVLADFLVSAIEGLPLVAARKIPVKRITEQGDLVAVSPGAFLIGVLLPLLKTIDKPLLTGARGAEGVMELMIGCKTPAASNRSDAAAYASRLAWEITALQQVTIPLIFTRATLVSNAFVAKTTRVPTRIFFQSATVDWLPPGDGVPGGGTAIRWDTYFSGSLEMG